MKPTVRPSSQLLGPPRSGLYCRYALAPVLRAFFATEWVPGTASLDLLTRDAGDAQSRAVALGMADVAAVLHTVPVHDPPPELGVREPRVFLQLFQQTPADVVQKFFIMRTHSSNMITSSALFYEDGTRI